MIVIKFKSRYLSGHSVYSGWHYTKNIAYAMKFDSEDAWKVYLEKTKNDALVYFNGLANQKNWNGSRAYQDTYIQEKVTNTNKCFLEIKKAKVEKFSLSKIDFSFHKSYRGRARWVERNINDPGRKYCSCCGATIPYNIWLDLRGEAICIFCIKRYAAECADKYATLIALWPDLEEQYQKAIFMKELKK